MKQLWSMLSDGALFFFIIILAALFPFVWAKISTWMSEVLLQVTRIADTMYIPSIWEIQKKVYKNGNECLLLKKAGTGEMRLCNKDDIVEEDAKFHGKDAKYLELSQYRNTKEMKFYVLRDDEKLSEYGKKLE